MIPKEPYILWETKISDNSANPMVDLVRYATLAPSSHNTQPWKFYLGEDEIKILPDSTRRLEYADRADRQLYISLGCALTNLLIAASRLGYKYNVSYLPEDELENVAVSIKLTKSKKTSPELFPFLTKRVTNRNKYLKRPIEESIVQEILDASKDPLIKIYLTSDLRIRADISQLIYEATVFAFNDQIFKDELSVWVRSVFTKSNDGIPLFGFGMPEILSVIAPLMIKKMPAKIQANLDKKLVSSSPALMVITSRVNNHEAWIKIGQTFELINLICTKHGISVAPLASIIEHPDSNQKLKSIIATDQKPLFFARLGYSTKVPHHSPRRDIQEVIVNV